MPDKPKNVKNAHNERSDLRPNSTKRGYNSLHQRQRKALLKQFALCQLCGVQWATQLHHIDRNPFNKQADNLQVICERCHIAIHRL